MALIPCRPKRGAGDLGIADGGRSLNLSLPHGIENGLNIRHGCTRVEDHDPGRGFAFDARGHHECNPGSE